jgi:Clr5 domain
MDADALQVLLQVGGDQAISIHISMLSHFCARNDRSPSANLAEIVSNIANPSVDDFVKLIVDGGRSCKKGLLSSGDFATTIASSMFNSGALVSLPHLVKQAAGLESGIQSSTEASKERPDHCDDNQSFSAQQSLSRANNWSLLAMSSLGVSQRSPSLLSQAHSTTQQLSLKPTPQEWQSLRGTIEQLYKKMPLRNVKSILEERYGFKAT